MDQAEIENVVLCASTMTGDTVRNLDVDKERLEQAPGFDDDNWPRMADRQWGETIHGYYGRKPYRDGVAATRQRS